MTGVKHVNPIRKSQRWIIPVDILDRSPYFLLRGKPRGRGASNPAALRLSVFQLLRRLGRSFLGRFCCFCAEARTAPTSWATQKRGSRPGRAGTKTAPGGGRSGHSKRRMKAVGIS